MKIALLINQFPSISETFVLNQITGLLDRGHEVDIYASRPNRGEIQHPDLKTYGLLNRTSYGPAVPRNLIWRVAKAAWLILANCFKDPVVLLRSLNFLRYGYTAASLRLLYWSIPFLGQRRRYDLIHCHFGGNGVRGLLLRNIGAISGILITTFHAYDISSSLRSLRLRGRRNYYDRLFREGDLFLPSTNFNKAKLIEMGCSESKLIVHRMGVDCQRFPFAVRQLQPGNPIRIVSVARLVEKKGIEYGVRAVAEVARTYKNIEYTIVGDGPLRKDLEALVDELGLNEVVHMLGWRQQEDVIEILRSAHILIAPSVTSKLGDQEGEPIVLMEALAMGLPVVSTYHTGIPELIQNGVSGFLVEERDVDALAEKLRYLISHPTSWRKMGEAGRHYVETRYDIHKLNQALIEIFQHAIRRQSTTRIVGAGISSPAD